MLQLTPRRYASAAILLALVLPSQSFAWNFVGHELVARIAWDQLTPHAREQVRLLIRQHPALKADLIKDMPADFGDKDMYAFIVSATWPDIIRSQMDPWHEKYHHPTWHYIDMPFIMPGTDLSKLSNVEAGPFQWIPGTDPTNVVQAMQKCEKDLRDPDLAGPEKAIALSWYLHLVGDVHQPLHANSLFSDRFPTGDKGGNGSFIRAPILTTQPSLIPISELITPHGVNLMHNDGSKPAPMKTPATLPADEPINLHAFWDNIFGRIAPPVVLDALQKELTTEYPPAALHQVTADLQYGDWAVESNDFAIRDVRLNGKLETGTQADMAANPAHPTLPPLPPDYMARAQEVARLRITTAGYRLAAMLNEIFAAQ